MPPKIMCDGCRSMFTLHDLKVHLGFDAANEGGQAPQLNNRGNRRTTAPAFNINDPSLFFERCPRRTERVSQAGAMQADECAPQSLPIVLPYHLGRAQLEDLKDQLLQSWQEHQARKAKRAAQEILNRQATSHVAPSASSLMRPREGRNVLLPDDVRRMNVNAKIAEKKAAEASAAAAAARDAPPTVRPKPSAPLPSFMRPLQRVGSAGATSSARASSAQPPRGSRVTHTDPQAVDGAGRAGRGSAGYVRVSAGQVVPYYVKL
ncbi:Hypothetical protein, putative [Bodo saltans]|uniref:Uncharacterized protein n=1 Tax=Bodo saltans TaxID=75058 RepID=A0A0S4IWF1_BODSA|nr:Hypothetical protein, putative [Bodo saltans]|eukprot:CUG06212.1 Hypothetical protein, putative [Bodo saltans]